jgi:ribonuclease HI
MVPAAVCVPLRRVRNTFRPVIAVRTQRQSVSASWVGRPILKTPPALPSATAELRGGSRTICFFDGACPGNQFAQKGPMRAAFVVGEKESVRDVPDLQTPDGPMRSNNIAEYHGLILLLRHLRDLDRDRSSKGAYLICGDSQLVIRQMRREYRVRTAHLVPLHAEASRLSSELDVEFREVPREKNRAGFLLE